jgi:hypothetical protein
MANNPYLMVRSRSEYYTSMSVSGLPTFLISVKNMNLLSSSIYKHLKTYLIKHKQSFIQFCIKTKCDRLYTILQKNGGTDTKAMGQTEPQFLSDPMSDREKSFRQLCLRARNRFKWYSSCRSESSDTYNT